MVDLQKLDNTIEELEAQAEELKAFSTVYSEITELKQGISNNLSLIKINHDKFTAIANDTQNRLEEAIKHLKDVKDTFLVKTQEIHMDNKSAFNEFSKSTSSQLEKHKLDIQTEMRNQNAQTERLFDEKLNSNLKVVESQFYESTILHKKQARLLKMLIAITTLIATGLGVGIYLLLVG